MVTAWEALVVSYGGGVDSTAMLVGLHARGIRPDLIVFADTGAEKPSTYLFVWKMNAWLAKVGFPTITIVRRVPPKAKYRSLEENCLFNDTLPSLAFGYHSCSIEWKIKPIDRFVEKWAAGRSVVRAIGYDAGGADAKRLAKAEKRDAKRAAATAAKDVKRAAKCGGAGSFRPSPGTKCWYPLTEWGWDRDRCKAEIAAAGLLVPPKSSCFFCPAMRPAEIAELATENPELFARGLAMEANARDGKHGLKTVKGLGRNFAWSDLGLTAEPLKEAA